MIPLQLNRTTIECDCETHKQRHLIERYVTRLKQFCRIATRYDKTARVYRSMLCIAATSLWIKNHQRGLAQGWR
jgi:transposase